ncbi:MAG TPA: glycosyltransferase family 9 protein, partial [Verrucomicrobiae bacterium]|nr:glycosyltransferase family 9 protein [Verrucomicrobiae bacterium]
DLGFLGDTIHLVPALWEIKDHYPGAELQVVTSPLGCEVLRMVNCVNRARPFPLGPPSPKWWEHWGLLRTLRRERFDVAFNFSGADRSVLVTAVLGAKQSAVYQGTRTHFWQRWLIKHWIPRDTVTTPVYEARRQMLARCGFNLKPARFDLQPPEEDRAWAREKIPAGAVHLSLSASFALKEWPLKNSVALARRLLAEYLERKLVTSAAPNPREQGRLEQFEREVADPRLLALKENLNVTRLAAMLERCAAHVGPDSGVLHLAAALNLPTVAIFRRYADMANWLPQGPGHAHLDAPCPCMESNNPACAGTGEAACLGNISPEAVARELGRVLAERSTTGDGT